MMSHLELRQIIESGFLPMKCVCTISPDNLMTVSLYAPNKGHPLLAVHHLNAAELTTCRSISELVLQLKDELARQHNAVVEQHWRRG